MAKKLSKGYVLVGSDGAAILRLDKGNYSAIDSLLGINWGDAPDGKTLVTGSVNTLVKGGNLAKLFITYERTANKTAVAPVYCALSKIEDAMNESTGLRSKTFKGKKITFVRMATRV